METSMHSLGMIDDEPELSDCLVVSSEKKDMANDEELRKFAKAEKRRIIKNVVVICLVFCLNFTAYWGLASLQSSLHVQSGMGVINMAIVYVSLALSCLVLPKIVIKLIGHKWSMSVSIWGYILWMAANGYAVWGTMVPASILIGVCGSTLWTGQSSYFNIAANQYALLAGRDSRVVKSLFFGIFFCVLRFSGAVSSAITSIILSQRSTEFFGNLTSDGDDDVYQFCGINDCPVSASSSPNKTLIAKAGGAPKELVLVLVGVCLVLTCLAFVISCVFVDRIPDEWLDFKAASQSNRQMVLSSLFATIKHMKHVKQLLLIPLTVYVGLQQTFLDADYSKSFVNCFLGIWMVGLCNIPRFILNGAAAYTGGRIVKLTGMLPVFVFGMSMDIVFQLTLLFWAAAREQIALFFIIPCFSALGDAVWQAQTSALYGSVFLTSESAAAFANYKFWESIGRIIGFSYSSRLCLRIKLYILLSSLGLGMALIFVIFFVFINRKHAGKLKEKSKLYLHENNNEFIEKDVNNFEEKIKKLNLN